jgi:hypothetical protein
MAAQAPYMTLDREFHCQAPYVLTEDVADACQSEREKLAQPPPMTRGKQLLDNIQADLLYCGPGSEFSQQR